MADWTPPIPPDDAQKPAGGGWRPPVAPEQSQQQSLGDELWEGLKNFGSGVARGVAGEGVPEGMASEFSGGRAGFGGRMVGAGARSLGDALWESLASGGRALMGEGPSPQDRRGSVEAMLPGALVAAGGGMRVPRVAPREVPPMTPQLALPPPKMGVAGQPATPTAAPSITPVILSAGGPTQENLARLPRLRAELQQEPRPGMLPPGPTSTMTTPASTPLLGQPKRPAPAAAAPPLIDAVPTSPLADAIAKNDGNAIDRFAASQYRRAVQPRRPGSGTNVAAIGEGDRRITTVLDTILANKPTLRVTDTAGGQKVPLPARPSMMQFAEALDSTKRDVFNLFNQRAQAAGDSGVRVDLVPVAKKFREIENGVVARDLSPSTRNEAGRLASVMEGRGSYSPLEAQEMVEAINDIAKQFYQRGGSATDTTSISALTQGARVLRDQLDKAVSTAPRQYQMEKLRYGAIRQTEQEVATAVWKMANKAGQGLPYEMADLFTAEQLLHGIINPANFPAHATSALATVFGKRLMQYLRDPNRAIGRMFERRERATTPRPALDALRQGVSPFSRLPGAGGTERSYGDLFTGGAYATRAQIRQDANRRHEANPAPGLQ